MLVSYRTVAFYALFFIVCLYATQGVCQPGEHNITWTTQSRNAGESMPCGGGDIGLNVWVENNDILVYVARSGQFDENNSLLKSGRLRIQLSPTALGKHFKQQLHLNQGHISITGGSGRQAVTVNIWVDVYKPVVHAEVVSRQPIQARVTYESWRYKDRVLKGRALFGTSYKWAPQGDVFTRRDAISFQGNQVMFYHHNQSPTVFDVTVAQQQLAAKKDSLYNPLQHLTFGGLLQGSNMQLNGTVQGTYLDTDFTGWQLQSRRASKQHHIALTLHTAQTPDTLGWQQQLQQLAQKAAANTNADRRQTQLWWQQAAGRSFIHINPGQNESDTTWQLGRNYQLMRYILACNAYGQWPTKFNGGLFTYDPVAVDTANHATPDYRNWGGGTFTAQNQRLVYFPLLKSGDAAWMLPAFEFYRRLLTNAELRTRHYWHHGGASFTEQLENFGLPNPAEYGWKRPPGYDAGMEYNAWLEYQWDTALEFCLMILEAHRYEGLNVERYLPLIKSCLAFFDEHYQYLARQRGSKALDGNGKLVLYPGSAAETFKMAYNSTTTIAGLKGVLERLINIPSVQVNDSLRQRYQAMLTRIPSLSFTTFNGKTTIAPAQHWERINNTEAPQLYPVFPWGMFGVGKPGLDTAINTFLYDTNVVKFRSPVGWKQDNIFAARLGLTEEAVRLNTAKLKNSGRRFPAFWGPGFDWTPDMNHGAAGMIGLQEMLLQTNGDSILLFSAWPKAWNVHFKLHAPHQTTIECLYKNGKIEKLEVLPKQREKDVVLMLTN